MSITRDIIVLGLGVGVPYAIVWYRRRRLVQHAARSAERYRTTFELSSVQASLDAHAERVVQALGPGLLSSPELSDVPFRHSDPSQFLRAAAAFAATRYQVTLPEVEVRFVSWLPNAVGHAAEVIWHEPWDLIRTGDTFRVVPSEGDRGDWQILVGENYRYDDELLLLIIFHEIAHVILTALGADLADAAENERLTDVAVALAGLGPLMYRRAYAPTWRETDRQIEYSVRQYGYLHQGEIEHLTDLRRRFAAADDAVQARISDTRTQN